MKPKTFTFTCFIIFIIGILNAQQKYEKPPAEILKILNAPDPPIPRTSPTGNMLLLEQRISYPAISDLAEPMLTLGGIRVNPRTNAERSYINYATALTLKRLSDGVETIIDLPSFARVNSPTWNATGTMFVFSNETKDAVELWVTDVTTQKARKIPNVHLNPVLRSTFQWLPDQKTLLVKLVPQNRGNKPEAPQIPIGPKIQESTAAAAPSSTYEVRDVLKKSIRCRPF